MTWTENSTEALKGLWANGLPASQIASILGGGLTRNAIIGKVHRLKLVQRRPTPAPMARKRRVTTVPVAKPIPDTMIPIEQRKTLLQLTHRTCRWPVGHPGDDDFFFCGAMPVHKQPYCAAHCQRAYRQPEEFRPKFTKFLAAQ